MSLPLIMYLSCYKCQKINPNCNRSYIDSPDWEKTKKQQQIGLIKNKCFEYPVKVALNHEQIRRHH